jgi:hypothetical protein
MDKTHQSFPQRCRINKNGPDDENSVERPARIATRRYFHDRQSHSHKKLAGSSQGENETAGVLETALLRFCLNSADSTRAGTRVNHLRDIFRIDPCRF